MITMEIKEIIEKMFFELRTNLVHANLSLLELEAQVKKLKENKR